MYSGRKRGLVAPAPVLAIALGDTRLLPLDAPKA